MALFLFCGVTLALMEVIPIHHRAVVLQSVHASMLNQLQDAVDRVRAQSTAAASTNSTVINNVTFLTQVTPLKGTQVQVQVTALGSNLTLARSVLL